MRAANTLSPAETDGLLIVTVIGVHALGKESYISAVIPIITLAVIFKQIVLVSTCQQLKGARILQLMEG
jgi:uncharacterized membrane protein (GlpM family)